MEMINTEINGRWSILLPRHRALRPEWNVSNGGWEAQRLASMYHHILPNDIVYYVGAEEMDMCGLVSMWGGKIIAIEPNDLVWPNGKAIYEANKLTPPLACFVGFAANENKYKAPDITYCGFPACADGPIISDHGFKEMHTANDIPRIKIDELVKITGLAPKHICMDIEGNEWEALKGAEQTLREHRPNIWLSIHPETMFSLYGQYSRDLRTWIKDIGYLEVFLDYQHELHEFYTKG